MTDPFEAFALQEAVTAHLAEMLPSSWARATLTVRMEYAARSMTFDAEVTGPRGEPALATPEVSQAIVAFLTHQRRAGQPCSSVTYRGTNRRGQWEFTGSVEYAD